MTASSRNALHAAALVVLGAVSALGLAGCLGAPTAHRYFQPNPSQVGPYANNFGEAVVPRHGLIVVQGDALAYGLGPRRAGHEINGADQGQAAMTISQALRGALGGEVEVENRGFPGDTVAEGVRRWAGQPAGNLVILAYGYGDMQAHTAPDAFATALKAVVRGAQAQGATVFVVLPPAVSDPLMTGQEAPYRAAAEAVARAAQAEVFDANASMARIRAKPAKTVAQKPAVYGAIAGDIAPYVKVLPPGG